jgi:hypothetical protein
MATHGLLQDKYIKARLRVRIIPKIKKAYHPGTPFPVPTHLYEANKVVNQFAMLNPAFSWNVIPVLLRRQGESTNPAYPKYLLLEYQI